MAHPRRIQCGEPACKRRYYADLQGKRARAIKAATGQWPHRQYADQQRDYDRRRRQEQPHWRTRYPEAAALLDARRRMLVEQATKGEPFAPRDVYERDQWTCGLCREPVDPLLPWPDPMSASVDHIVPLSRGGEHSLDNVQSAHLSCNCRKGDQTIEEIAEVESIINDMITRD
jgi:5-methylcytosine-specific restriction endonuclease McrA